MQLDPQVGEPLHESTGPGRGRGGKGEEGRKILYVTISSQFAIGDGATGIYYLKYFLQFYLREIFLDLLLLRAPRDEAWAAC